MKTPPKLVLAATWLILSASAVYEARSIAGRLHDLLRAMDGLGAELGALDGRRRSEAAELSSRLEAGLARLERLSEQKAHAASLSLDALSRRVEVGRAAAEAHLAALLAAEERRSVAASAPAAGAAEPAAGAGSGSAEHGAAESDLDALSELDAGRAHFAAGDFASARDRFAAALRLQSDNPTARLYSALSLFRLNPGDSDSYPVIERDLRLVLESDPGQKDALDTLGLIAMERGEWSEAERYFVRRIGIDPSATEATEARKMAGFCALYGGRPDEAADYFNAVLRGASGDSEAASLEAEARAAEARAAESRAAESRAAESRAAEEK